MPSSSDTPPPADAKSLATQAIEVLFDQENVPERRRSKTVQELLGTSYHAAHRRMTDGVPWMLEDLERVAAHYGRTLADLFQALHDSKAVVATFVAGGFRSACRLWLGDPVDPERATPLVAWREGEAWMVGPSSEHTKAGWGATAVLLQPSTSARARVAVLDDDAGYTRLFKAALTALGYAVDAYTEPGALLESARARAYDAYVIDWLLEHKHTAEDLCRSLRSLDASALLILQSGQLANDDVDENDLLRTAMALDMEPVVKPVRPSFLAAKIERHMAQRQA
jgi:CheY-like chemotaxis protein